MKIPFTNFNVSITRRGISLSDMATGRIINVRDWMNKFSLGSKTPILENIYDTIATEFSKIDLLLTRDKYTESEDGIMEHKYEILINDPMYELISLRPNIFQTKSELLYTIAYQLHEHANAIVRIIRDDGSRHVIALEPINLRDYEFGQGYEIGDSLYLKLREKVTGRIMLLDYNDTIHLRLNPNDIFYGDKRRGFELNHFVKLFDENLNSLFNELKENGTIKGIVEVGGPSLGGGLNSVLGNKEGKTTKQKEIIDRIKATDGGILVLDSGEKWISLSNQFKTMTTEEVNNFMKYLYNFKGINQAVIDGTANEAQMEVFFNKSIMPIIERLIEEMKYKCLTKTARTQGTKIEHFKNPFEYMSTSQILDNVYKGAMFFTKNETRRMAFKLPPLPGGDAEINNKNFEKEISEIKQNSTKPEKGGEKE